MCMKMNAITMLAIPYGLENAKKYLKQYNNRY